MSAMIFLQKRHLIGPVAVGVLGLGLAACSTGPSHDEDEIAAVVATADSNQDGALDRSEIVTDATETFILLDRNGDGVLAMDEMEGADVALFEEIDVDGDEALTLDEVVTHKMRLFEERDSDGDDVLIVEEAVS